jgi:alkylation response protein AidB-like acyl-CoA dehydrogenase
MMQAVGPYAVPYQREAFERGDHGAIAGPSYAPPLAPGYCNMRKTTIYSGSNEIQRNIISRMLLGL